LVSTRAYRAGLPAAVWLFLLPAVLLGVRTGDRESATSEVADIIQQKSDSSGGALGSMFHYLSAS
jgi:hypothetical protein